MPTPAEIRARLDAATPGEWGIVSRFDDDGRPAGRFVRFGDDLDSDSTDPSENDAQLIAHAPADLLWLLAEHDRLTTIAEQHSRLCLAEDATEDAVWPCGCRAQIIDSHGSRKLIGEPCYLHEQAQAIVLAAHAWKDAKEAIPQCVGYEGGCDGDLAGDSHEPTCPCYGKPLKALRIAKLLAEFDLLSALAPSSAGTGVVK